MYVLVACMLIRQIVPMMAFDWMLDGGACGRLDEINGNLDILMLLCHYSR